MSNAAQFKAWAVARISPLGVRAFFERLPPAAKLLDLGCGNNGPFKAKSQRPDLHYIGIDVGDYNQTAPNLADAYHVVAPEAFASMIEQLQGGVDAVVSSHNIEHCLEPERVLQAMVAALRPGGMLYLSFPSEASVDFPRRAGCLNFHDDPTHRDVPRYLWIKQQLQVCGCEVMHESPRYRPLVLRVMGGLMEPFSWLRGRTMPGTWALYGFESVLWLRRPLDSAAATTGA